MLPKITLLALVAALLLSATALSAQTAVQRDTLGKYPLEPAKSVSRVEVQRLTLPPGGKSGRHIHAGPVVSYVLSGRIVVQPKGEQPHTYTAGQSIVEPANTPIEHFDNLSATEPAVFVANYLLSADDHELVRLLK
jgi:quercetin dioxygenase-like cupin family protein